jgi:hypothetical protein
LDQLGRSNVVSQMWPGFPIRKIECTRSTPDPETFIFRSSKEPDGRLGLSGEGINEEIINPVNINGS